MLEIDRWVRSCFRVAKLVDVEVVEFVNVRHTGARHFLGGGRESKAGT